MNNDLRPINTIPNFKRFCMTIGELPTSYLETMTYYEMLVWFTEYMKNTIIPTINNNGLAIQELQEKYIELKTFVDNYFDNLDVQEEINNKLDEMAESGELTDIIAQYLGLAGMLVFNTVADMKEAINLVNGSTCQTIGFYQVNDKGGSLYKIREILNTDTVDDITIVSITNSSNLIAELVYEKEMNIKQFGAVGDGVTDDTSKIQTALDFISDNTILNFDNGTYRMYSNVSISKNHITLNNAHIIGLKQNNTNSSALFNINNSNDIIFDKCYFEHGNHCIHLYTCENIKITNCTFDATGYAIIQENGYTSSNVIITGNSCFNTVNDFIECNCEVNNPSKNWIVSNNLYTKDNPPASYFTEDRFIGITAVENVNISNNIIEYTRGNAIHFEDLGGRVIVDGNIIKDCYSLHYIDIEDGLKTCIISNNYFENTLERPSYFSFIGITGGANISSYKVNITGNTFIGNGTQSNPIYCSTGQAYERLITNNMFYGFANLFSSDNILQNTNYLVNLHFHNNTVNCTNFLYFPANTNKGYLKSSEITGNKINGNITIAYDSTGSVFSSGDLISNNKINGDISIANAQDFILSNNLIGTGKTLTFQSTSWSAQRMFQFNNYIIGTGLVE